MAWTTLQQARTTLSPGDCEGDAILAIVCPEIRYYSDEPTRLWRLKRDIERFLRWELDWEGEDSVAINRFFPTEEDRHSLVRWRGGIQVILWGISASALLELLQFLDLQGIDPFAQSFVSADFCGGGNIESADDPIPFDELFDGPSLYERLFTVSRPSAYADNGGFPSDELSRHPTLRLAASRARFWSVTKLFDENQAFSPRIRYTVMDHSSGERWTIGPDDLSRGNEPWPDASLVGIGSRFIVEASGDDSLWVAIEGLSTVNECRRRVFHYSASEDLVPLHYRVRDSVAGSIWQFDPEDWGIPSL